MAERYSKRLLRGHRPRKLYNQLLTAATSRICGKAGLVLSSQNSFSSEPFCALSQAWKNTFICSLSHIFS